jgi:hypothetical protein
MGCSYYLIAFGRMRPVIERPPGIFVADSLQL